MTITAGIIQRWRMAYKVLHTTYVNSAEWQTLGEGMPQLFPHS